MSPERPGVAAPDEPSTARAAEATTGGAPSATESQPPAARRRATPSKGASTDKPSREARPPRSRARARRVRRIVRHVDPWSVLKISILFYLALFLILCVASTILWSAARSAGTVDQVEDFITSLGFGNCEDVDGGDPATTTTVGGQAPAVTTPTTAVAPSQAVPDEDDTDGDDCPAGQVLVGEFQFEDGRILQAGLLGGLVLVVAGAAFNVVLAVLFNLISDVTGGVRVTVLEEEPVPRTGSPAPRGTG